MAKVMEGRKVVMVEMPSALVARIDAAASRELLNRSSWLRRPSGNRPQGARERVFASPGTFSHPDPRRGGLTPSTERHPDEPPTRRTD